jgi:ABC-type multidrug transport system fused ATPase/permease subunit
MFKQCRPKDPAFIELERLEEPPIAPECEDVTLRQILAGVSALLHSEDNLSKLMGVGLLTALGTGLNFLAPYLFGETIKLLATDEDSTEIAGVNLTLTAMIIILVTAYTLSQALPNGRGQLLARVIINAEKNILKNATEHFLKKSLNFHVNTSVGEMIVLYQKTYSVTTLAGPLYAQIIPVFIEIAIASALLSSQYGIEIGLSLMGMIATYTGYFNCYGQANHSCTRRLFSGQ